MAVKRRAQKRATYSQAKAELVSDYTTISGKVLKAGDIVTVYEAYTKHCIIVDKHNNWYDIPRTYLAKA